jgi:hypothetical protein
MINPLINSMKKPIRIPNNDLYDFFFTITLGICLLIFIYGYTPNKHCSVYFKNKFN